MKLTILVDNIADKPLVAEHGFSVLLEIENKKILFDTGQNYALIRNAELMGISLENIDALVLSHGHYDHSGNIANIINLNPDIQFYAHPECLIQRWSIYPGKDPKSSSMATKDKEAILSLPQNQINWITKPTEIMQNVWLTGEIERKNSYEDIGNFFYKDINGKITDIIKDDMTLLLKCQNKTIVICGCCHSGINNTLEQISNFENLENIDMLIGGFHLIRSKELRITKTINFINSTKINQIVPMHCTGEKAVELFQQKLSSNVILGKAGLVIQY